MSSYEEYLYKRPIDMHVEGQFDRYYIDKEKRANSHVGGINIQPMLDSLVGRKVSIWIRTLEDPPCDSIF